MAISSYFSEVSGYPDERYADIHMYTEIYFDCAIAKLEKNAYYGLTII